MHAATEVAHNSYTQARNKVARIEKRSALASVLVGAWYTRSLTSEGTRGEAPNNGNERRDLINTKNAKAGRSGVPLLL